MSELTAVDDDVVTATMRTYDRIAPVYESRAVVSGHHAEAAATELRAALAGDALVADLGCGPGLHAELLRRLGLRVVGADLSVGMAALAATRVPVVRADLRHPPFATGSLDAVWSFAALLHVPAVDTLVTLERWRRLLRPGGHLVLSTAVGDDAAWEPVSYDTGVRRWYVNRPAETLTDAVRRTGFTIDSTTRHATHRDWLILHARADPHA